MKVGILLRWFVEEIDAEIPQAAMDTILYVNGERVVIPSLAFGFLHSSLDHYLSSTKPEGVYYNFVSRMLTIIRRERGKLLVERFMHLDDNVAKKLVLSLGTAVYKEPLANLSNPDLDAILSYLYDSILIVEVSESSFMPIPFRLAMGHGIPIDVVYMRPFLLLFYHKDGVNFATLLALYDVKTFEEMMGYGSSD